MEKLRLNNELSTRTAAVRKGLKMTEAKVPTFDAFMNPVIQALKDLGGSGTIEEINYKASEIEGLSDEQLEVLHDPEKGGQTEVEYRLAWTRTYLKKYGVLENSSRGVWALTPKGRQLDRVNPSAVTRLAREHNEKGSRRFSRTRA